MERQIIELNKQHARQRALKRIIALVCVFVMLFTVNSLKMVAQTLSRIPMCGLKEHQHKAKCYDDSGALICGKQAHRHTDACYQESPTIEVDLSDDLVLDEEVTADNLMLDISAGDLVQEDVQAAPVPEGEEVGNAGTPSYRLGAKALLSKIIRETGLKVGLKKIREVGVVDNDGSQAGLLEIKKGKNGDYRIKALRDFDLAELAIVLADEVVVVKLVDGVGASADELPVMEEQPTAPVEEATGLVAMEEAQEEEIADEFPVMEEQPATPVEEATGLVAVEEAKEEEIAPAVENVQEEESAPVVEETKEEEPAPVVENMQEEEPADGQTVPVVEDHPAAVEDAQIEQPVVEDAQIEQPVVEDAQIEQPVVEDVQVEQAADDQIDVADIEFDVHAGEENTPAEEESASVEEEPVPAEGENTPTEEEAVPAEGEVVPAEEEIVSTEEESVPAEGENTPTEEEAVPAEEEAVPAEEESAPAEEESASVEEEVVPAEEEAVPAEEEAVPAEEESAPAEEENVPVEEETAPAEEESAPVEEEAAPAEEENVPTEEEAVPAEEAPVPAGEEAAPGEEETVPVEQQYEAPAPEAAAPADVRTDAQAEAQAEPVAEAPVSADEAQGEAAGQPVYADDGQAVPVEEAQDEPEHDIATGAEAAPTEADAGGPDREPEADAVADAPAPEVFYPAQFFTGVAHNVTVEVTAPEGAFPEGTVMTVSAVYDTSTLSDIADTVSDDFTEVKSVRAVDITFSYNGAEIEPLLPISVVMSVPEIEEQQSGVVVHVDDRGSAEVVTTEAPAEVAVEMPATSDPQSVQAAIEEHAAPDPEGAEQAESEAVEAGPADDGQAIAFTAASFSIYAYVVTETIETHYIDAEGTSWKITVGYGQDAMIPSGAALSVAEVTGEAAEAYLARTAESMSDQRITLARFFDITILDAEGNEVQPDQAVEVRVELEGNDDDVKAVHFDGEGLEVLDAEKKDNGVIFDAESFSVYGIVYTVDFEYNGYAFSMPGGGVLLLSELFEQLNIDEDVADVDSVTFTDETLLRVEKAETDVFIRVRRPATYLITMDDVLALTGNQIISRAAEYDTRRIPAGEWILTSLRPFDTFHRLTVAMRGGYAYDIDVQDAYNGIADTVSLEDVVSDVEGSATKAISVKLTEGGSVTDMSRTASLTMRVSYVLTSANLECMQEKEGSVPTITYDFRSVINSTALGNLKAETVDLYDGGKNVGTVTIDPTGVAIIQFTDEDWFDKRTQLGGYFDLHLEVISTEINDGQPEQWIFPGAPTIGPIHYKDVLSDGGKAYNAQKLKDDAGRDYYLLDYTASIHVNSDVTNVTFVDTLMTDGVDGGIQEVVYGSARLDGVDVAQVPVSDLGWIDDDPHRGFSMVIPSLAVGQHTVSYQVKIPADVLEGMTEGQRKDAVNRAEWRLTGDKTVPGGETHYQIEKPYREVRVQKTAPETADPDSDVNYAITFGDGETPLAGLTITDSITDIQKLNGRIRIRVPGRDDVYIDGSSGSTDDHYSTNMHQLFRYQFAADDPGYGPVTVEYSTHMIDVTTARQSGIFNAVDAINTAAEQRTWKSDSTTTTVVFPRPPKINVDKTATLDPDDVDEDGNWKPGAEVQYTVTIGEPGEDLSYIRINDQMSIFLSLQGDISVTVDGSASSAVAIAFKEALDASRNGALTGQLFNFTMPEGTVAPIVITYTAHLKDAAEANAQEIFGAQHVNNYVGVGNEHDDAGGDVIYPDEYALDKRETHEEKAEDGTQIIHWTVTFGDGVDNDMGGARIYDEMTMAQKLVDGSVQVKLSAPLERDITWPDSTVWAAGSDGPFAMPAATGKTHTDGVLWTKFYSTDTNYSIDKMVPVFNLKLPEDLGHVSLTVTYDTVIISDLEALEANITGLRNVKNRVTVGHSSRLVPVEHEFPNIVEHKPKAEKAFSHFDFENRLVYWTIAVSADTANGSGYPLKDVQVQETTRYNNVQYSNGVPIYDEQGNPVSYIIVQAEDFDLSKVSVRTESGTMLEPGVDFTVDYSFIGPQGGVTEGDPIIHFPELNEKVYITIAFSTGNNDIISGFEGKNKVFVYSRRSQYDYYHAEADADCRWDSSEIDVTKAGKYDAKTRLIKWMVCVNPKKSPYGPVETIMFEDQIPAGHVLVNYSQANDVFDQNAAFDAASAVGSPSMYVHCVWKSTELFLDGASYQNGLVLTDLNIFRDNNPTAPYWGLNEKPYEVTYYTWVDDAKWAEITSGLSGFEKVTNTATVYDGDDLIGKGSGTTTVTTERVITKRDVTTVVQQDGKQIISTSDVELHPSSILTYNIDINPNREQLTEPGKKLSVTDNITTKMELNTDSIKLYYFPVDGEKIEVTTAVPGFEDLTIGYNDDTRTMSVGGIPDETYCLLEYTTTARAMGEQVYTNTATLIGGGSHSHTVTNTYTVQNASAGISSRTTTLKLKKIDENNVTTTIDGATFELYECALAGGTLEYWRKDRVNPDPSAEDDDTYIRALDWSKINAALDPDSTDHERLLADFSITSETRKDAQTTANGGIAEFKTVYDYTLYCWKETSAPPAYDAEEIGVPHYFVLYSEKHAHGGAEVLGQVYDADVLEENRREAKALDEACSLANGKTVAFMVSDNDTTWNVNNIEKGYTSISATKQWQGDSDDFFKTRPAEGIQFDLYKVYPDGSRVLVADRSPVPLNVDRETGTWPIVTWNRLPKRETLPGGQTVSLKYTVVERPVANYTAAYSDDNAGVTSGQLTVTNTLIPVNTRISVKKVFDESITDLPDQIAVKLWQICTDRNGAVTRRYYSDDVLSISNNWQYTWRALPTRDDDGNTFTYTVEEDVAALAAAGYHYTALYSDEGQGVTAADVDDPLLIRNIPNGLRILKTLAGDGALLTDAIKQQIRITVEKVGGNENEQATFTLAEMTVGADGALEKLLPADVYPWIDDGSLKVTEFNPSFRHFGVRSVSYTINGGVTSEVTDDLGCVVIQNVTLPDGKSGLLEIVNDYAEEKTELPVKKLWQNLEGEAIEWPSDIPAVNVELMKVVDGAEVPVGQTLTLTGDMTEGVFTNLPKYEFNTDRLIEYTVRESLRGFTATVTDGEAGEGADAKPCKVVTNRKDRPKLYVEKIWNGSSSFIPASIRVQLYESDTPIDVSDAGWTAVGAPITITAADNWQGAFENLTEGKYYKVEEVGSVSGWTLESYSGENGAQFSDLETVTITNRRTPPPPGNDTLDLGVQKAWTEDGSPVAAPDDVDHVNVRLVRYRAEAGDDVQVKVYYYDNGQPDDPGISRYVASASTVTVSLNPTDVEPNKLSNKDYKYGYSIYTGDWWETKSGDLMVSGSSIDTVSIDLDTPGYRGQTVVSVVFGPAWGDLARAHLHPEISGKEPAPGDDITWEGPVEVDYSAINPSVGEEYDRTTRMLSLSPANAWQYEFKALPKKGTEDGKKYFYRYAVQEVEVPGFTASYAFEDSKRISLTDGTATALGENGVATVTNNRETVKITARKKWGDNIWPADVAKVGVRLRATVPGDPEPTDITSELGISPAVNGNAIEATIARPASGNEASVSWWRLPKYDAAGNQITYAIEEIRVTVSEGAASRTYDSTSTPSLADFCAIDVSAPNAAGNATITNTLKIGALKLKKVVTVNSQPTTSALADGAYVFKIVGPAPADLVTRYVRITVSQGVATAYRIHEATEPADWTAVPSANLVNGWAVIPGLPVGDYTITETQVSGMTARVSGGKDGLSSSNQNSITVTVNSGEDAPADASAAAATFTNNRDLVGLQVSKAIEGNGAEAERNFNFIVSFKKAGLSGVNGSYKKGTELTVESDEPREISFTGGTATIRFSLKGGERAEFYGLPEGTEFIAQENPDSMDANDYVTTVSSEGGRINEKKTVSGTVVTGTAVTVSYVNARYSTTVEVVKQNADTLQPLSGATFELRKLKKGEDASYEVDTDWDARTATTSAENHCRLVFADLPDGFYRLQETHVPAGYARTGDHYIYFRIAEGVVNWMMDDTFSAEKAEGHQVAYRAAGDGPATFIVGNTPGVSLPATGGSGTAPIHIGGAAMALLALALLLRRRAHGLGPRE